MVVFVHPVMFPGCFLSPHLFHLKQKDKFYWIKYLSITFLYSWDWEKGVIMRPNNPDHWKQHFSSWKTSTFSSEITVCSTTIQLARNPTETEKNRHKQTAEPDPRPLFTIKCGSTHLNQLVSCLIGTRSRFRGDETKIFGLSAFEGRSRNACAQNGLRVWTTHGQVTQQERFSKSGKTTLSQERNPKITRGSMKFASPNTIMSQTGFIGIF